MPSLSSVVGRNADRNKTAKPSLYAFFSYGFRPFFLAAASYAALLMPLWIVWILSSSAGGGSWLAMPGGPYAWHAHELVFGFASAAIAGFLLTAVPNWTGALPISGPPLAALFAVWLAGRLVVTLSPFLPHWLTAAVDLAFLPMLGAVAARQLLMKPAARNLVFVALLTAMTAANAVYHAAASGLYRGDAIDGPRAALMIVALMITIIGGRIVPAFTHNWLHLNKPEAPRPVKNDKLDMASIASFAIFAACVAFAGPTPVTGVAAMIAAITNGARLYLWRGWQTTSEPIVWVLHAGYAWIPAGALLYALATFGAPLAASSALHAFSTGAAGTMILAVMTRASLGHTGRPLVAPAAIVWSYRLILVAACLRVFGPVLLPQAWTAVMTAAAIAWVAAYGIFAAVYAPILTTPRVHLKAGSAQ